LSRIFAKDLDLTPRDWDALDPRLQSLIESVWPQWSDYVTPNYGNVLRGLQAHVGDVVDKYRAAQNGEAFFTTCTRRQNGVKHGRPLGYRFAQQTAATVNIQFSLNGSYDEIPLTAGSIIRSTSATNPAEFQILVADTIPAGVSSYSVSTENSKTYTFEFESTGLADQQYLLAQSPFLKVVSITDAIGSFVVGTDGLGVENFLNSGPTDAHFQILLADSDKGLLVFGSGVQGRIPSGKTTVVYKTGGGAVNVEEDTLTQPGFTLQDVLGASVSFSVTNPAAASGGNPRESLAQAQLALPGQMQVNQRSVAQPDYGTNAKRVAGIAKALILTSDQMTGIPENYGFLYVVAEGVTLSSGAVAPTTASQAQKDSVRALLENTYKPTITFEYEVADAIQTTVDITARVRLDEGAVPATVDAAIRSNLADYFAVLVLDATDPTTTVPNDNLKFGAEMKDELGAIRNILPWSKLFDVVNDTTGVDEVDKQSFQPFGATTVPLNSIPVLGTVTLVNDRTGDALV
jgi:hypothetical protein